MATWDPLGNLSVLRPEARFAKFSGLDVFVLNCKCLSLSLYPIPTVRIAEQEIHLLGWNVPAHELHTIPEHWLSHQEPQASMHYLLGLLYVAFTIVALTGNGLVIWVFSA